MCGGKIELNKKNNETANNNEMNACKKPTYNFAVYREKYFGFMFHLHVKR